MFGVEGRKDLVGKPDQSTVALPKTVMSGIEKTPAVCGGDACIARSRVPVWSLAQARDLGLADEALLDQYPTLTQADLDAAWAYAAANPAEITSAIRDNEEA